MTTVNSRLSVKKIGSYPLEKITVATCEKNEKSTREK
jgi:hypothetical protein